MSNLIDVHPAGSRRASTGPGLPIAASYGTRRGRDPGRAAAMRWWRSLRVRLTVGFAVFAVVTVGLAATAAVLLIEEVVLGQLDTVRVEEAQTLASFDGLPDDQLAAAAARNVGEEREQAGRKFVAVSRGRSGAVLAGWYRVPRIALRGARRGHARRAHLHRGRDERLFRVADEPGR